MNPFERLLEAVNVTEKTLVPVLDEKYAKAWRKGKAAERRLNEAHDALQEALQANEGFQVVHDAMMEEDRGEWTPRMIALAKEHLPIELRRRIEAEAFTVSEEEAKHALWWAGVRRQYGLTKDLMSLGVRENDDGTMRIVERIWTGKISTESAAESLRKRLRSGQDVDE